MKGIKTLLARRALSKTQEQKGFTLIEVIVVLVILAILAAIAVPALTGYIKKADQRAVIAEASTVQTALQAVGTDVTVTSNFNLTTITPATGTDTGVNTTLTGYTGVSKVSPTILEEVNALTGGSYTAGEITSITYNAQGTLTNFKYDNGKYIAEYDAGSYSVTAK